MSSGLTITILGCGASSGSPVIGGKYSKEFLANPKNYRTRASIYIQGQGTNILVDTSPDMRQQFLRQGLSTTDAILYTHAHADHCHGINDTKVLCLNKDSPIPIWSDDHTLKALKQSFSYCFLEHIKEYGWFRPRLEPNVFTNLQSFKVGELEVLPIKQIHGTWDSYGFRIGDFAYCTDVKEFPPDSFEALKGVKTLIIDCLRDTQAPTHADFDLAISWINQLKPDRAILTHLAHHYDYDTLKAKCPPGVEPAYDGMKIEIK